MVKEKHTFSAGLEINATDINPFKGLSITFLKGEYDSGYLHHP